jgi:hypothetical protein
MLMPLMARALPGRNNAAFIHRPDLTPSSAQLPEDRFLE